MRRRRSTESAGPLGGWALLLLAALAACSTAGSPPLIIETAPSPADRLAARIEGSAPGLDVDGAFCYEIPMGSGSSMTARLVLKARRTIDGEVTFNYRLRVRAGGRWLDKGWVPKLVGVGAVGWFRMPMRLGQALPARIDECVLHLAPAALGEMGTGPPDRSGG